MSKVTFGELRIAFENSTIPEKDGADYIWTDYDSQVAIEQAIQNYKGEVIFASGNGTLWKPLMPAHNTVLRGRGRDITILTPANAFYTTLTSDVSSGNVINVADASGFHAGDMILIRDSMGQAGAFYIIGINCNSILLDRNITFSWLTGAYVWQKYPPIWINEANNVTVRDLTIDGNAPNQEEYNRTIAPTIGEPGWQYDWSETGASAILSYRSLHTTLESVRVINTQSNGISADTWDYRSEAVRGVGGFITLRNVQMDNIGSKGYEHSGICDGWVHILDSNIDYTGKSYLYHASALGGHGDGVIFHDGLAPDSRIEGNTISRALRAQIKVSETRGLIISRNILKGGNPNGGWAEGGIYTSSGLTVTEITDSIIDLRSAINPACALETYGSMDSFTSITGNIIHAPAQAPVRLYTPSFFTGNAVFGCVVWAQDPAWIVAPNLIQ